MTTFRGWGEGSLSSYASKVLMGDSRKVSKRGEGV